MDDVYKIKDGESEIEYCHRIALLKDVAGLQWYDIAKICNAELGTDLSPDGYRCKEKRYRKQHGESYVDMETYEKILELKKERVRITDEKNQIGKLVRSEAREDRIREIAVSVAKELDLKYKFPKKSKLKVSKDKVDEAILLISDWHYGIKVNQHNNQYDREIAKDRVCKLEECIIKLINANDIRKLYVVNLGDLISGDIHTKIKINNEINIIKQTFEVAEILANFLNDLSNYIPIEYHDTLDNHSRIEKNKDESVDAESFVPVINELLKLRLRDNKNITFVENVFGDDIATFKICNHNVIAVHGDKDKPKNITENLTLYTGQGYDLILSAHLHHFSSDEVNQTIRIGNGSLIGTDDYAASLRKNTRPSQTLIISSDYNVVKSIHKIDLE